MQGGAPLVTFVGLKPPVTKFDLYIYISMYMHALWIFSTSLKLAFSCHGAFF